jgi:hypothetical protein
MLCGMHISGDFTVDHHNRSADIAQHLSARQDSYDRLRVGARTNLSDDSSLDLKRACKDDIPLHQGAGRDQGCVVVATASGF